MYPTVETEILWGYSIPTAQIQICTRIDVGLELFIFQIFLFYSFRGRGEDLFLIKSSALCNVLYINQVVKNKQFPLCLQKLSWGQNNGFSVKKWDLQIIEFKDVQCFKF